MPPSQQQTVLALICLCLGALAALPWSVCDKPNVQNRTLAAIGVLLFFAGALFIASAFSVTIIM